MKSSSSLPSSGPLVPVIWILAAVLLVASVAQASIRRMSKDGQPAVPRYNHSLVWTGSGMIVWGGVLVNNAGDVESDTWVENSSMTDTGGIYRPASNSWAATSTVNAPAPRAGHSAVWTGSEMIIWGGRGGIADDSNSLGDGWRYSPSTDQWRPISSTGAPSARGGHTAVWTGREMIIWGGEGKADGAAYDPSTDSWRTLPAANALGSRRGHGAVWAGDRMVIWGGSISAAEGDDIFQSPGTGEAYDPVKDQWETISEVGGPPGGSGYGEWDGERAVQLFWTGQKLLVFVVNSSFEDPLWVRGGSYDFKTRTWESIELNKAPTKFRPYFGAWNGSQLYIASSSYARFRGAAYDFDKSRWRIRNAGSTGSLQGRAAVWAPELQELLVFGGRWTTGLSTPKWSGGPRGQRGLRIKFPKSPARSTQR